MTWKFVRVSCFCVLLQCIPYILKSESVQATPTSKDFFQKTNYNVLHNEGNEDSPIKDLPRERNTTFPNDTNKTLATEVVHQTQNSILKVNVTLKNYLVDKSLLNKTTNYPPDTDVLHKIHFTLTRSTDAVWATVALTFLCVVLFLAVAQSGMWKDYHGSKTQDIPLPNFNERVPFREVMERKVALLKEMFGKKKKKKETVEETELEALIIDSETEYSS